MIMVTWFLIILLLFWLRLDIFEAKARWVAIMISTVIVVHSNLLLLARADWVEVLSYLGLLVAKKCGCTKTEPRLSPHKSIRDTPYWATQRELFQAANNGNPDRTSGVSSGISNDPMHLTDPGVQACAIALARLTSIDASSELPLPPTNSRKRSSQFGRKSLSHRPSFGHEHSARSVTAEAQGNKPSFISLGSRTRDLLPAVEMTMDERMSGTTTLRNSTRPKLLP